MIDIREKWDFYQNVSNRSNFLRNIFYFCTFMAKTKKCLTPTHTHTEARVPPPRPHTHTQVTSSNTSLITDILSHSMPTGVGSLMHHPRFFTNFAHFSSPVSWENREKFKLISWSNKGKYRSKVYQKWENKNVCGWLNLVQCLKLDIFGNV